MRKKKKKKHVLVELPEWEREVIRLCELIVGESMPSRVLVIIKDLKAHFGKRAKS